MPPIVLDTNVPIVANGKTLQAGPRCVLRCINKLEEIRSQHCLLTDDQGLIFSQYRDNLSPSGQPGPGDAFFKWLWDNQGYAERCRFIFVTPSGQGSFAEFPSDPAIAKFDLADHVFVAVAVASGESPPIINATDTDWWLFRQALSAHGLIVEFLCPELMSQRS